MYGIIELPICNIKRGIQEKLRAYKTNNATNLIIDFRSAIKTITC